MKSVKPGFFAYDYTDGRRARFDVRNQEILDEKRKINTVFIGDSITEGLFPDEKIVSHSIVNSGIGGDRTNFMVERFVADVLQLSPQKVVILGGVNDLIAWDKKELLAHCLDEEVVDYLSTHLMHMVQLAHWGGAKEVYLGTILPVNRPTDRGNDNDKINRMIININNKIMENKAIYSYQVLDYHILFLQENNKLDMSMSDDGLHPNQKGNEAMLQLINQKLYGKELLK